MNKKNLWKGVDPPKEYLTSIFGWDDLAIAGGSLLFGYLGNKNDKKGAQQNIDAINEARDIIAQGYTDALGYLDQGIGYIDAAEGASIAALEKGTKKAIAAVMEGAKKAAAQLLEDRGLALEQLDRFFYEADSALRPFIDHGILAQDEVASMLGIPGQDGSTRMYDLDKLKNTPGYQFIQDESMEAVMRSRIGNKLSTGTGELLQNRAGNIAAGYFDQRVNSLQREADRGGQSASVLAQIASQFGGMSADTILKSSPANVYMQEGTNIGNLLAQSAGGVAELIAGFGAQRAGVAGNKANLAGDLATANANLGIAEGSARSGPYDDLASTFYGLAGRGAGSLFDDIFVNNSNSSPNRSIGGNTYTNDGWVA